MTDKIAKGIPLLQKEAELVQLQAKYTQVRKNLKSNKTRLKNDREQIASIQQDIAVIIMDHQEKILALHQELIAAMKNLHKSKKIPKPVKKDVHQLLERMKSQIPSEEEMQSMYEEIAQENANKKYEQRLFERFHKRPPDEEQKSIRKIYIELSKKFHPDLAKNSVEHARLNQIMIKIVQAYETHDIEALLAIKKELRDYESETTDLSEEGPPPISIIQQKINLLIKEINLLNGQLTRTREELKELRSSQEGELLQQYKRAKKYGDNIIDHMKQGHLSEIDSMREMIKEVNHYAQTGELYDDMQGHTMGRQGSLFMDEGDDEDLEFWELMEILEEL